MIKSLQHLKALKRAPQGTLAFRSYLPMGYRTILYDKTFGCFEAIKEWNKNVTYGTNLSFAIFYHNIMVFSHTTLRFAFERRNLW